MQSRIKNAMNKLKKGFGQFKFSYKMIIFENFNFLEILLNDTDSPIIRYSSKRFFQCKHITTMRVNIGKI